MTQIDRFNFSGVISTAISIILDPLSFYRHMERNGGYRDPLTFVVVMGLAAGVIGMVFSLFGARHIGAMGVGFGLVVVLPIMMVVMSFIGAAFMFVIWKLLGSEQEYQTAFRCVAYSMSIFPVALVAGLVPYFGTLLATAWSVWLMIVASEQVHGIDKRKATMVLGILGLLMVLMNVQGERGRRQWNDRLTDFNAQMDELQNMSPEEAGKAVGEFMKGVQQGSQDN